MCNTSCFLTCNSNDKRKNLRSIFFAVVAASPETPFSSSSSSKRMDSFLVKIFLTSLAISAARSYDPEAEMAKRLEIFRKTCQKYDDDLTYEYPGEDLTPKTGLFIFEWP